LLRSNSCALTVFYLRLLGIAMKYDADGGTGIATKNYWKREAAVKAGRSN
jgi:hypothetical protein